VESEPPLPPVPESRPLIDEEEEEGVTSQEEFEFEEDEEGVDEEEGEEGLELDWQKNDDDVEDDVEPEDDEEGDEGEDEGSMSPTDAATLMEVDVRAGGPAVVGSGQDPICYHCGVALIDPPLRLSSSTDDLNTAIALTSPKISIPLHCEVCIRGIHSQCHISLGGSLPTQEESFVCFHCRTSQHGKYAMKSADRVRVSVGPAYQVPLIPDIFFARKSTYLMNIARERFVQVWSTDASKTVVSQDKKIFEFLREAAHAWPDKLRVISTGGSLAPGSVRRLYLGRAAAVTSGSLHHYWCPFSADYAMTVLHRCNYDTHAAIAVIKNPLFRECFTHVCFPPTKPYYNKWKPKDRRWRMMKIPFPPSRIEAPMVDSIYDYGSSSGDGPRLRSRRYHNY